MYPNSLKVAQVIPIHTKGDESACTNYQWRTQKIFMGGFQSAKIFLCTKIESMIRKNIKQAAIQYVNVVKQL